MIRPLFGNIVHSVLEKNVNKDINLNIDSLKEDYISAKKDYDPDNLINNDLVLAGNNILEEFYDRHLNESFNIKGKEIYFAFVIGSFYVNGYIDRIDEYENRIEIIDYKTR